MLYAQRQQRATRTCKLSPRSILQDQNLSNVQLIGVPRVQSDFFQRKTRSHEDQPEPNTNKTASVSPKPKQNYGNSHINEYETSFFGSESVLNNSISRLSELSMGSTSSEESVARVGVINGAQQLSAEQTMPFECDVSRIEKRGKFWAKESTWNAVCTLASYNKNNVS